MTMEDGWENFSKETFVTYLKILTQYTLEETKNLRTEKSEQNS
jgi:hypothetical protein